MLKSVKRLTSYSNLLCVAVLLTACGGGGSDSGAGSTSQFVGIYNGNETLQVVIRGQTSPSQTFPLRIVIDGAGNVTVTDVDGTQYKGTLNGTNFVATGAIPSASVGNVTCSAVNVTYRGTIAGNDITGSSNGTGTCTGPGGSANATIRGPFKVTKAEQAKEPLRGGHKSQAIIISIASAL
ncbi:MAG: hypothetical protein QNI91_03595 [Arenicellales bacterium]|nr:hypothetical protein [Arenicellales bacterium]